MKRIKILLSLLVLACVFLSCSLSAFADDCTYTVRIFAGNQGTIDGGTVVVNPTTFDLDQNVAVTSDRYYAKGIRESGKDINPYYMDLPASIDHDTDYVVVYGLNTNRVILTIRYLSTGGAVLAEDRVLYANVNDKPMVKALYIDGYAPDYLYITGTLTTDTTWEFTYYASSNTTVIYGEGGNAGGVPWNQANDGNAGGYTPVVQEILDIDVPLAGPDAGTTETPPPSLSPGPSAENDKTLLEKFGMIIFWIILLAGLGFLYWFFLFFRKKKQRDQETKGPGTRG